MPPAEVLIATGFAAGLVKSSVKIFALMLVAGSGSIFSVKAISFESGEIAQPQLPPSAQTAERRADRWASDRAFHRHQPKAERDGDLLSPV